MDFLYYKLADKIKTKVERFFSPPPPFFKRGEFQTGISDLKRGSPTRPDSVGDR
jgi:hypothetical protein